TKLLGHTGVYRSPVHAPEALAELARAVASRDGFRLVGIMAYEAQIAGVTDKGHPIIQAIKRTSIPELAARRGEAVALVRDIADAAGTPLEFVNGGGTGSIESTREDPSVTEVAAGSGLFGPHLFDHYVDFTPAPAVAFTLNVVRRPAPEVATLLGGGWIASGPPAADRMPLPVWPEGLRYLPREGAGEVQTPLRGAAASALNVGDRVWLRHTKSGEVGEHVHELHVVSGSASTSSATVIDVFETYRGEGKVFL
ncbi:MAG: amino acid deaminase/aldolase, partial [Microbacterium sp.]